MLNVQVYQTNIEENKSHTKKSCLGDYSYQMNKKH